MVFWVKVNRKWSEDLKNQSHMTPLDDFLLLSPLHSSLLLYSTSRFYLLLRSQYLHFYLRPSVSLFTDVLDNLKQSQRATE